MKECVNKDRNLKRCTCTYEPCARKGICCECIAYHIGNNEIPGCFFSAQDERTYNRSRSFFIRSAK
jgi:hypothetical protein